MKFDKKDEQEIKRNNKKKKSSDNQKLVFSFFIFLIITIIILIIYFFFNKNNTNIKKKNNSQNTSQVAEKKVQIIDENSNDRPIAVMIDNNIGNEKHAGLQDSYLNYEIIVEGGLTRIMAIFKDKDVSLIGPVRSSRHYFLDYALESDAIYIHYGWSPYAKNDIESLNVDNINGLTDEVPFWRNNNIKAPHNVFTSIEKIKKYAQTKNYPLKSNNWKLFKFSADEVDLKSNDTSTQGDSNDAIAANQIFITYSTQQARSYNYDNANKYYLRSMNGIAHLDKVTNLQLHYKNIIIEKVENYTLDSYGRQDLKTVSTGDGYFITNGYAKPITWKKLSRNGKTEYKYNNGQPVILNDGNTFIQIVPLTSNITIN